MSKHKHKSVFKFIPQSNIYPDYRRNGPYVGFDPMDYCAKLRERVQSGELSWDAANALWRNYADGVAAVWVDEPRPGPCAFGGGAVPKGSDYYRDDDVYYPDGDWGIDSPTIQEEYFDALYDEFDPETQFGVDSLDPVEPWQATPEFLVEDLFAQPIGSPSAGFAIQDEETFAPPGTAPRSDGPGGAPFSGQVPPPWEPQNRWNGRPPVVQMFPGQDGIYRDMLDPQRFAEYWADRSQPVPVVEVSPYMGLPVSSSFSIKGSDCGCSDCQCGGG